MCWVQNSGRCNSFYCLGHFKNVYDDDDDDDDDDDGDLELATRRSCFGRSYVVVCSSLIYGTCKIKSVFDRQDLDAFMSSVFIFLDLHY